MVSGRVPFYFWCQAFLDDIHIHPGETQVARLEKIGQVAREHDSTPFLDSGRRSVRPEFVRCRGVLHEDVPFADLAVAYPPNTDHALVKLSAATSGRHPHERSEGRTADRDLLRRGAERAVGLRGHPA